MAINTYRFWMATDANRLLANQNSFIQASPPVFYQGNVANLELHIVSSAGVGTTPVEVAFPAGAAITVAVGQTNTYPTGGTWQLMVGTIETADMPYNATTAQVQAALNAITDVSDAGGVTVTKTGDGYTITWNTYGAKPSIGIGSDTLTPSSYESISLVQQGTLDYRQIVFVELRQNPIALGVDWTALPQPGITVVETQPWDGVSRMFRVTVSPIPKAGTMTFSYGTKSAIMSYDASASAIGTALECSVFSTGQYQWDFVLSEDSALAVTGNLIGYNGYSGSINFATAEMHQFLAGASRKTTNIEVSMSVDGERYTLLQTTCTLSADVVSDGVIQPLPLGTAMSEQVANARFVRRDTDQSPDGATQNQIWSNLGLVNNDGTDVVAALAYASSPSFANPFVTLSDISGLGATWGNITGTLSDQTDLQAALDGKYDASNPNGYIQDASADGNLYGRKNGMWEVVPSSSSVWGSITGTLSDQTDLQGALDNKYDASNPAGFIDASSLAGYATESWVYSQDFITSGAISDMATMSWVTGQGYATETWVQTQGFVYSDSYGRVHIGAGYNPDSSPVPGLFWYQSEKLRFSNSTSSINTVASEAWADGKFQTLAGMSSYAQLSGATFTGKVNLASIAGAQTPTLNLGATVDPNATNAVSGDLWVSNAASPKVSYKVGSSTYYCTTNNLTNTFSSPQVFDTTSNTLAAVRITQKGTFPALVVEDSTNPDTTATVIDANGNLGVNVDPATWTAANKVEVVGNVKASTFSNGSGPTFSVTSTAAHSGGTDTLDLLVTINGTNYRIGLRPA